MAIKTVFVVQAFETHRKRLVPTTKTEARNEASAHQQAEQVAVRKGGAAVIALTLDTESGEVSAAKILARFGAVPDDLDQLVESF
jgi:hypothetical protein